MAFISLTVDIYRGRHLFEGGVQSSTCMAINTSAQLIGIGLYNYIELSR